MRIWLDDLRDPQKFGFEGVTWFKTSQEFMGWLNSCSKPYRLVKNWHFDNDLGEESEQDGYDCLLALEEKLVFGEPIFWEANLFVHTSNPAAATKFMLAKENLSRYGISVLRNNY